MLPLACSPWHSLHFCRKRFPSPRYRDPWATGAIRQDREILRFDLRVRAGRPGVCAKTTTPTDQRRHESIYNAKHSRLRVQPRLDPVVMIPADRPRTRSNPRAWVAVSGLVRATGLQSRRLSVPVPFETKSRQLCQEPGFPVRLPSRWRRIGRNFHSPDLASTRPRQPDDFIRPVPEPTSGRPRDA